jgi:outer membrane protein assembly factor BamE (lipoprotein component of BamABCDE complex)
MKHLWLPVCLFALSACEPVSQHRGIIQQTPMIEQIETGMSEDDMLRRFGSHSTRASFGPKTWYYIQSRKEAVAFLKPEITQQQVIAVTFNSSGFVETVKDYNLKDREQVAMIKETTPTEGHSIGFLEQVLGNVGRFNNTGGREINPRGPAGR